MASTISVSATVKGGIATLCLLALHCVLLAEPVSGENDAGKIWPVPVDEPGMFVWPRISDRMDMGSSTLSLDPTTFVFTPTGKGKDSAMVQFNLKRYFDLIFFASRKASPSTDYSSLTSCEISIESDDDSVEVGVAENYKLTVQSSPAKCSIEAPTPVGALRALETLSNLIDWTKEEGYFMRGCPIIIEDSPKYAWRGLLVDSARRFLPKRLLKDIIDALSYNKLNTMHWHLTDAESFPFKSQKHPDLAKGAFSPLATYTAEDIGEIVQYGAIRGVRVYPELDTPAHTGSWGIGMPEIIVNCNDNDGTIAGASLNPAVERTYEVVGDIIEELAQQFIASKYFHIGSDELLMKCWQQHPVVQAKAAEIQASKGVSDGFKYLYCDFVNRVSMIVKSKGLTPIMWDDIHKDAQQHDCGVQIDVASNIFQIWHYNMLEPIVNAGYKVVVSVEGGYYLNNGWERIQDWLKWRAVYESVDPAGSTPAHQRDQVLGGEMAMWGESTDSSNYMPHCLARLAAGAERMWSKTIQGTDEAQLRVLRHRCRLLRRGLNIRALDFDNGDFRRGRWYQCEVYLLDVAEARGDSPASGVTIESSGGGGDADAAAKVLSLEAKIEKMRGDLAAAEAKADAIEVQWQEKVQAAEAKWSEKLSETNDNKEEFSKVKEQLALELSALREEMKKSHIENKQASLEQASAFGNVVDKDGIAAILRESQRNMETKLLSRLQMLSQEKNQFMMYIGIGAINIVFILVMVMWVMRTRRGTAGHRA